MTLLTTENDIAYSGLLGNDTFAYTFRVEQQLDMVVTIDNVLVAQGDFTMTGLTTDIGGDVILTTPLVADAAVVLQRVVEATQETDYQPFDAFPSETHEDALDKLTMLAQQNTNASRRALRMPAGDTANVVLPDVPGRASKYLFFDPNGDANVIDAVPDPFSVLTINVAPDTVNMLRVDTQTLGTQHPTLQFLNINTNNGVLQLTDQGKIPNGLINFIGLQARGAFRGDDLCDKPGDDPGDCLVPDSRNPSQRFTELEPTFSNGDYFIITMQDPEVSGTMDLFVAVGDAASQVITVQPRDGVIFLDEVLDPNDSLIILVQRGWYFIEKLVDTGDASFITYDPTTNTYVLGTNVQVALDAVETDLVARDAFYVTQKNASRFAIPSGADLNLITQTGFYAGVIGTLNLPNANNFNVIHSQFDVNLASQIAITDDVTATIFYRSFTAGAWSGWQQIANIDFVNTFLPLAGGTLSGILFFTSTAPTIQLSEIDAAVDEQNWRLVAEGAAFRLRTANDAEDAFIDVLTVSRAGATPVLMTITPNLTVGNGTLGGIMTVRAAPAADASIDLQTNAGQLGGEFLLADDNTLSLRRRNPADQVVQTTLTLDAVGNVSVNAPVPINDIDLANKGYVDANSSFTQYGLIASLGAETSIPAGWDVVQTGLGLYTLTHNLNLANADDQVLICTPAFVLILSTGAYARVTARTVNSISYDMRDQAGVLVNEDHNFIWAGGSGQ